jgi:hypothetical protein
MSPEPPVVPCMVSGINPLNAELNSIRHLLALAGARYLLALAGARHLLALAGARHLLALVGAHHFVHVSRIRVKLYPGIKKLHLIWRKYPCL